MNRPSLSSVALLALSVAAARGQATPPRRLELRCHRTANQDVPENTLESLEQAALQGCELVEIDVRRTLDGVLVLNHDGSLERLTDGFGEVESTYSADLLSRDAGSWMGARFAGLHPTTLAQALSFARDHGLRLFLDIKQPGAGAQILQLLREQGMLDRVEFGGEWDDIHRLQPDARSGDNGRTWVSPGVSQEQVQRLHRQGQVVVVNFSANPQQFDLNSMKAAVAAGADSLNVDYPRLGAEAVGRPVETTIAVLTAQASAGSISTRSAAILELGRYRGFNLQPRFFTWIDDPERQVSRAAAVALVEARPQPPFSAFAPALRSHNAAARANAAWALGRLQAPAKLLLPLLTDRDTNVLAEALLALVHAPGRIGVEESHNVGWLSCAGPLRLSSSAWPFSRRPAKPGPCRRLHPLSRKTRRSVRRSRPRRSPPSTRPRLKARRSTRSSSMV